MEFLEKNKGWKEPDFDTVLQYLRTVLLRRKYDIGEPIEDVTDHTILDGASLIYTSQNTSSQLPSLIHSTLGITSLLKRQTLKNNVIDRDKILVPPNWDSWGKIRVLGGSFDAEQVSKGWEEDLKTPLDEEPAKANGQQLQSEEAMDEDNTHPPKDGTAVVQYEAWCRDPNSGGLAVVESAMADGTAVGVESEDTQEFLERQLKILEAFKITSERAPDNNILMAGSKRIDLSGEKSVKDHIGPVQFNMGGIQVDADDMLQRLKVSHPFRMPVLASDLYVNLS